LPIDTTTGKHLTQEQLIEILTTKDTIETDHYDYSRILLFKLVSHEYQRYLTEQPKFRTTIDSSGHVTHYYKEERKTSNSEQHSLEYLFTIPDRISENTKKIYSWNDRIFGRYKLNAIETSNGEHVLPGCFISQTLMFFESGDYTSYYGRVSDSCTSESKNNYEDIYEYKFSSPIIHSPTGIGHYFIIDDYIHFFTSNYEYIDRLKARFSQSDQLVLEDADGNQFKLTFMKD
jgi:hypothetical protein